ncbi:MAG: hypothetical protein ACTSUX_09670 [Promethearchaeota archaeon]
MVKVSIKRHGIQIIFTIFIILMNMILITNHFQSYNDTLSLSDEFMYMAYSYAHEQYFTLNSPNVEICSDIAIDNEDNIYLAGRTGIYGNYKAFLVKFDSSGKQLWNYTGHSGVINQISLDSKGDVYYINGKNVMKISRNGTLLWEKSFNTTINAILIKEDSMYLAGVIGNFFLMKCNLSGNLVWNSTWTGMDTNAIAIDSKDNIYLIGSTQTFGAGDWDACLIKFNSTGKYQWHKTFGGPDNDYGKSILIYDSNKILISGTTRMSLDYEFQFIAKYYENGTKEWHWFIDTIDAEYSSKSLLLINETYYNMIVYTYFLIGTKYFGSSKRFTIHAIQASACSFHMDYAEWRGQNDYFGACGQFDSEGNLWISATQRNILNGNYDFWFAKYGKDSDFDDISDFQEINIYNTNPNYSDSDHDKLTDYQELKIYNTNPNKRDTDNDLLTDYEEIMIYNTDPNNFFQQHMDMDTSTYPFSIRHLCWNCHCTFFKTKNYL